MNTYRVMFEDGAEVRITANGRSPLPDAHLSGVIQFFEGTDRVIAEVRTTDVRAIIKV